MKKTLLLLNILITTSPSALATMTRKWSISSFPLPLRISEDFSPKEVRIIKYQADAWEKALDYELDFFNYDFPLVKNFEPQNRHDYFPLKGKFDPKNLDEYFPLDKHFPPESFHNYSDDFIQGLDLGIYKSNKWFKELRPNILAITYFSAVTQKENEEIPPRRYMRILHADIIFNYKDHLFSNDPKSYEYDFSSVIVHELGHLIGLQHDKTGPFSVSTMKALIPPKVQRRKISKSDRKMLRNNYFPDMVQGSHESFQIASRKDDPVGLYIQGTMVLTADGECLYFFNDELPHVMGY